MSYWGAFWEIRNFLRGSSFALHLNCNRDKRKSWKVFDECSSQPDGSFCIRLSPSLEWQLAWPPGPLQTFRVCCWIKPCLRARLRIFFNSLVIPRGNPGRELEGPRGGGGAVLDGAPLHGGPGFGRRRPGWRVARSCGRKEKVEDCRFQRSPIFRARSDDDRKGETPAGWWMRDSRNFFRTEQETNCLVTVEWGK